MKCMKTSPGSSSGPGGEVNIKIAGNANVPTGITMHLQEVWNIDRLEAKVLSTTNANIPLESIL